MPDIESHPIEVERVKLSFLLRWPERLAENPALVISQAGDQHNSLSKEPYQTVPNRFITDSDLRVGSQECKRFYRRMCNAYPSSDSVLFEDNGEGHTASDKAYEHGAVFLLKHWICSASRDPTNSLEALFFSVEFK